MSAWAQIVGAAIAGNKVTTKPQQVRTDKHCPGCEETKPLSDFYPRSTHSLAAVSTLCRVCHSKANTRKRRQSR